MFHLRSLAALLALTALLSATSGCHRSGPLEVPPRMTAVASPPDEEAPPMSAEALMAHVEFLAGPALEGRLAGSRGERLAAQYVTDRLEQLGLPSAGSKRAHPFSIASARRAGGKVSQNIYALLDSSSPEAQSEFIVVGAHVDHVGIVDGELYPGAEDNASGVAVVLEVARALRSRRAELRRSVIFAFFGAEEIGLYGSRAFIRDAPVPLERISVMVNLDMVGRPLMDHSALTLPKLAMGIRSRDAVGVIGTRLRPQLRALVVEACGEQDLTVYGPEEFSEPLASFIEGLAKNRADHSSFEDVGIPAVFFSSGESTDYHQPTDVPSSLDPDLMQRRAHAIADTVVALSWMPWAQIRATGAQTVDPEATLPSR